GVGDTVRRLAAILPGHSRTRLRSRHPRTDVLAGREPPVVAQARQASAHDAVADARLTGRRALPRLGIAWRRPAGPVDDAAVPAPRPRRPQSPGGDRRAGLALGALPDLVLAAHRTTRCARRRKPDSGRDAEGTEEPWPRGGDRPS